MEALIPRLGGDETAHALVTFEVAKSDIPAPADPSSLRRPKRPPRQVRNHLEPSPLIESRDPQIKSLAKEITDGRERAWDQVEAIYDWVRANIRYEFDAELKGALAALRQGKGDCEELTSLFVALCRAQGVPARSVWVPGHCYPEFFLEDEQGRGYWLPCQAAGASRQFGAMSESRPILQKGDKFQIPGLRKPQRYAQPTLTAQHASAPPQVEWVQQAVKD
jgi:transglutaminase-like putative cysteine protease